MFKLVSWLDTDYLIDIVSAYALWFNSYDIDVAVIKLSNNSTDATINWTETLFLVQYRAWDIKGNISGSQNKCICRWLRIEWQINNCLVRSPNHSKQSYYVKYEFRFSCHSIYNIWTKTIYELWLIHGKIVMEKKEDEKNFMT